MASGIGADTGTNDGWAKGSIGGGASVGYRRELDDGTDVFSGTTGASKPADVSAGEGSMSGMRLVVTGLAVEGVMTEGI